VIFKEALGVALRSGLEEHSDASGGGLTKKNYAPFVERRRRPRD
jgi:hypothetical protein